MNQNIFCSKCHRIPSQCCCSSAEIQALHNLVKEQQVEIEALKLFKEQMKTRKDMVKWLLEESK